MGKITVNANNVKTAAASVSNHNNRINQALLQLKQKEETLFRSWSGPASDEAQALLHQIYTAYGAPRLETMELFAKYLNMIVAQGYEAVEETNKSLADLFR